MRPIDVSSRAAHADQPAALDVAQLALERANLAYALACRGAPSTPPAAAAARDEVLLEVLGEAIGQALADTERRLGARIMELEKMVEALRVCALNDEQLANEADARQGAEPRLVASGGQRV